MVNHASSLRDNSTVYYGTLTIQHLLLTTAGSALSQWPKVDGDFHCNVRWDEYQNWLYTTSHTLYAYGVQAASDLCKVEQVCESKNFVHCQAGFPKMAHSDKIFRCAA